MRRWASSRIPVVWWSTGRKGPTAPGPTPSAGAGAPVRVTDDPEWVRANDPGAEIAVTTAPRCGCNLAGRRPAAVARESVRPPSSS